MAVDPGHGNVGAYVLGVLDPADIEPFEAHLATCDSCADEVASLLPVVARLPAADAESLRRLRSSRPGADRAAAHAESQLPRHGRQTASAGLPGRLAVAAAITAVVLAVGSFVAGRWSAGGPAVAQPTAQPAASVGDAVASGVEVPRVLAGQQFEATDAATGASARIVVVTTLWGSQIDLSLRGVRGPLRCELLAVGADAGSTVVASWLVGRLGYGVVEQPNPLRIQAASAISLTTTSHFAIRATRPDGSASTLVSIAA